MLRLLITITLFHYVVNKCAFRVLEDGQPQKLKQGEQQPHIVTGLTQCVEYNGKLGCCDSNNDNAQVGSYTQIDGIFGTDGGGCDLCAINLKRFWCQYACSPRQSDFLSVSEEFFPVPDPQNPDQTVMVQQANLTVNSDTACSLYNSCKRIAFVTSVSAMSSPAGFLTFQGHNAVDQAFQYISTTFSYKTNDSLYFSDDEEGEERKSLQDCNFTTNQSLIHGFEFKKNCSCNNCQFSCDSNSGFIYRDSNILEGFNWVLIAGVWSGVIIISTLITVYRKKIKHSQPDIDKEQ